jgi:hypothetical protein
VKCVTVSADQTKQQPRSASGSQIGTSEGTKQPSSRLTPAAAIKDVFLNCSSAVAIQADSPRANRASVLIYRTAAVFFVVIVAGTIVLIGAFVFVAFTL